MDDKNSVHPEKDPDDFHDNNGYTAPDEGLSDTSPGVPEVPPPEYNALVDNPSDDKADGEDFTTVPLDGK